MDKFIDKAPSKRSQGKPQQQAKKPHFKEPAPPSTPNFSPTDSEVEEGPSQLHFQAASISQHASEMAREVSNLLKPIFESQFKGLKKSVDSALHLLHTHSSQLTL
ncbi:Hypothetical predicted protein, partial [Pelobates cultripes]